MQRTIAHRTLTGIVFTLVVLTTGLTAASPRLAAISRLEGAAFVSEFLTQMIQHEEQGVLMAQTAAQYADREDIRHYGVEITVTQLKEIDELEALRGGNSRVHGTAPGDEGRQGFGAPPALPRLVETASSPDSPQAHINREILARLTGAGERFDETFIREMSAHYGIGLEMSRLARERADSRRVKDLAEALVQAQSREVAELKRLQAVR